MAADRQHIEVRGISVEVVRKDIRHLHVGVYPPNGRVRVAAPHRLDDDAVRLAVISRLAWIRRRRGEFEGQERQSRRELVTGESHYFEGRRYRLDVIEHDRPAGGPSAQQQDDAAMRPPRRRPGYAGSRTAPMVSAPAARPAAGARGQVGAEGRGERQRRAHQEDEDPLGLLQPGRRDASG